ncbi:MAG: leucine-rich repeat domain-containing protein, partial [Bacilli bacterium]|nr:leucine-rich repeat domain-containing protein [Bacilli bacterium]
LLIYKIDSSIIEEDYISSINMMCQAGVGNLDLLFDVKDNLSRKELYIYTISKHILTKTLDRTLGFYEEIFYYANEFDLFDNLFYVGKEILEKDINNPDNIYLVSLLRDLLYISKDYITIDEFTSDEEAINVYQQVVGSYKKTYRNALNGVFYKVGSPNSYKFLVKEKNAYIHPYFWNLKLVLYGRTEQRMSLYTPLLQSFNDELGMFQPYQGDKEKYIGLLFLKRNTLCNETIKELLNSAHVYGCAFDDIVYKTTTPKDEIPTNINYYNTQKVVGVIADVFGLYENGPYHYISGFSNCYKNNLVTIVYNSNYNSLERELFPLSDLVHNKKKKYLRLFVEGTSDMGIKLDNYNVSEIHLPMDVKNEKQIIEIRKNKIKLCGNIDRELEKEGYDFCSIRYAKRYRDIYIGRDEYEHLVSSDVNKFYSDEQLLSFLPLLDEHYHHDKFVYVQNNGVISLCRQSSAVFKINITNHTDKPQCCYANFDIDKYKDVFVVNDHYVDIICYYLAENTIKKHVFEANLKKEIYRQDDKVYDIDAYGFNIHVEISNLFQGTFSVYVNLESCHLDDEIITLPSFKDILGTDKEEGVKVHYVLQVHLFENLPNLKKVIIPEDVTLVQDEAFYNCPNLKEIVFAESGVIDIYSRFLATGKDVEVKFPSNTNYNFIDFTHIKTNNYKNGRYIGDGDNKYAYLVGMIDKSAFFEVHDDCKEILCDIRSVLKASIPYRLFKEKHTKGLSGVLEVIIRNAPYTIEDLERYAHSEDIDDYYYVDDTFVFDKKSRSIHKVTSKDKVINIPEYFEIKGNKHYVRWIAPFSLSELQNQKVIIPGTVSFFDVYAFGRFDLDGIELVLSEGVQTIFNSGVYDYQSELKDFEELNEQISDPIAQEENRELVGSVEDCVIKNLDYLFIPDSYDFVVVDLRIISIKTLDDLCKALKICPLYSSYDVETFVSFAVMNTLSDIKYIDHNATDEQVKRWKRIFNGSFGLNAFVKNSHTRFYKDDNITAIISGSNTHIYRTKIGKDGKIILPPVEQEIKEISVRKIDFLNSGDISTLDFRNLIIYPGLLDDLLFVEIENLIINQKTEIYDTAVKYKNVYFDEEFFPRRSYNSSTVLSYIDAEHFYIKRNGEYVLIEDLDINDTNIYRGEYCHLKQIKSVTFGKNVRSIVGAFNDLDNVKSIIVTEGVLEIDESFKDCLRLEEIILPQSLMRFTNKSLSNCPNLKKIIIPLHVRQYLDIDNRIKEEITKEDGMVEIYF